MRVAALLLPLALFAATPLAAAEPVTVPAFRSIELRGGGTVTVRPGPARVTIVEGSSSLTRFAVERDGKLVITACAKGNCRYPYKLRVDISYPRVPPVAVKGGGSIVAASGFARQNRVAAGVSGGGTIDLRGVAADSVAAAVNGGGQILSGRSGSLAAAINGGGEIRYLGNPRVTTAINGGGVVRQGS